MSKTKLFVLALAVVLVAGLAAAQVQLDGYSGSTDPLKVNTEAVETLFRGDLIPELGIGCSNAGGTSGGPNDIAVSVTASLAPPFGIINFSYNVFTASGAVNTHDFVAWAGGGTPGTELGRQAVPPTGGNNTAAITPFITVGTPQFFFGINQPQTNAGMRWGVDTGSGGSGWSILQAPTCGLAAWGTLTSIGFPGNWVMAAVIDDTVPVELMSYDVD